MNKCQREQRERIAVVGMACRLPGAKNYDAYWDNLRNERCSVSEIPADRWPKEDSYSPEPDEPNKSTSKWGGFIDDADLFDPMYFGISPREAQYMDPQQRIMLELATSCFEDAGYSHARVSGSRTSVFISTGNLDHGLRLRESQEPVSAYWATGVHLSVIPNRISYMFNLNGPSVSVDTACSGSLLALHQGIQSLRAGDSTMALIGGCSILMNPTHFASFSKMGMLSPDGQCRTFDETANGYVRGEGAAFVLIKSESQALADGDRILGVISGSAVNHGGHARTLTSPNAFAQARVIIDAHTQANVSPDSVSYIEAHGTGTPKGDPIEVVGLKRAFAKLAQLNGVSLGTKTCAIGSAKTNLGHLEPVAGMASLIKVLLSLKYKELPRLLHFTKLNPRINLDETPFYMLEQTESWAQPMAPDGSYQPLRAGISGFGFGGTNVHVVLEEAPLRPARLADDMPSYPIFLSGKTQDALARQQSQLVDWLSVNSGSVELRDLSATLLLGRDHWNHRLAFQAQSIEEVQHQLSQPLVSDSVARRFTGLVTQDNADENVAVQRVDAAKEFLKNIGQRTGTVDSAELSDHIAGVALLGQAFVDGLELDWSAYFSGCDARCIALPTYPFARKRYPLLVVTDPGGLASTTQSGVAPSAPVDEPQVRTCGAKKMRLSTLSSEAPTTPARHEKPVLPPLEDVPAMPLPAALSAERPTLSEESLRNRMRESLAAALYLDIDEVDIDRSFVEQGLDSVVGVEWMRTLNRTFALGITVTKLYDYPSVTSLASFVAGELGKKTDQESSPKLAGGVDCDVQTAPSAPRNQVALSTLTAVDRNLPNQRVDASGPQIEHEKSPGLEKNATTYESNIAQNSHATSQLQEELKASLAAVLYMDQETIEPTLPFVELGLDSVVGVEWIRELNKKYKLSMSATKLYDFATLNALTEFLANELFDENGSRSVSAKGSFPAPLGDASNESLPKTRTAGTVSDGLARSGSLREASNKPLPSRYGLALSTVQTLDETAVTDWSIASPARHEATISVRASAINFPDVMCVEGLYPTMPEYPFVPGFEAAGVIVELGDHSSEFAVGDEVIAVTGENLGGHASHVNVPVTQLIRKPTNMTFEQACSIPVIFSTVQHAFDVAKLAREEHVLIQTATGGCGLAALQMARLMGCVCYGTSSKPEKLALLDSLGVAHTINYKTTEFDKEVLSASQGRGVDAVLNMLSGDAIQRGLNCLAPGGRYLEIAVHALRTSQKLDLSRLVNNQSVHSIDLRRIMLESAENWRSSFSALMPLFESKQLVPVVSRIYPIAQIVDAMRYVKQGNHIGKVVISHTMTDMVDCTDSCVQSLVEQGRSGSRQSRVPVAAELSGSIVNSGAESNPMREDDIAVIGMSGQFPQAKNLQQFWKNLSNGKDCIAEVPENRFHIADYFDASGKVPQKTYCKWMGALDDVDQFDPLFFNIAPSEARLMDPEQRLFIQNVWHCLEDAGIPVTTVAGSKCGVFVGCASGDYGERLGHERLSAQGLMGGSASILAGRVSYFFDLQGPCLSIDTACSSSLAAVAEACESLSAGTSNLALAGGAYVMAGPSMHVMTSQAGMLSKTGRCHTFDQNADGFVPGEGVGVVLLKRLSDARRDGDRVYGVIKGWGIKQDGKTNGITAPSVNSQITLEKEVYSRFSINPEKISLVEAHGTGTKLGDPIEVEALTESFGAYTKKKQFCVLGSVKSNIGHGLTSAGIGGLIKVMLCMQHKKLVPSANYTSSNEHINFDDSPFLVNTELRDWIPDVSTRMAAISSFGFSGTNVHIVMEDAPQEPFRNEQSGDSQEEVDGNDVLITLSAKEPEKLGIIAASLRDYISEISGTSSAPRLDEIAYSLQVGRDPMECRLAFCVSSYAQLLSKLDEYAKQEVLASDLSFNLASDKTVVSYFEHDCDAKSLLKTWFEKGDVAKLGELWQRGLDLKWQELYLGRHPKRVGLPGYPFAQERYWVDPVESTRSESSTLTASKIHPLVHENVSSFGAQRYQSSFTGQEFFLSDHRVRNKKVLPGVAHLEMARVAIMKAVSGSEDLGRSLVIKDVHWIAPISMSEDETETGAIEILFESSDNLDVAYRIQAARGAQDNSEGRLYSTGCARFVEQPAPVRLDIEKLRAECNIGVLSADDCYEAFGGINLHYGSSHQGLSQVFQGNNRALAKLRLPEALLATKDLYELHPTLLDSALQACIGMLIDRDGRLGQLALPSQLREVQIHSSCDVQMWAYIRQVDSSSSRSGLTIDVDLCDNTGLVCVRLLGVYLQSIGLDSTELKSSSSSNGIQQSSAIGILRCDWHASEIEARIDEQERPSIEHVAVFCEVDDIDEARVIGGLPGTKCIFLDERKHGADVGDRFQKYAKILFESIQRNLTNPATATPITYQVVATIGGDRHATLGLSGLLRSASLESKHFRGQFIGLESAVGNEEIVDRVLAERSSADTLVRYRERTRIVPRWQRTEQKVSNQTGLPWIDGGVYLITGGAGGLGFVFAEEIVKQCPGVQLVLAGRSALSEIQKRRVEALRKPSNTIQYCQVDIADKQAVADLMSSIHTQYGGLNGVLHSAGVVRDGFIRQKINDIPMVLAPKVSGLLNLDEASADARLDFFVVFSSIAGVTGNIGQADYAAANAFADAYMVYREQLVVSGARRGRSLSIDWPFWIDGGMQVDESSKERIDRSIGSVSNVEGVQAFYSAIDQRGAQVAVTAATPDRLDGLTTALTLKTLETRGASVSEPESEHVTAFVIDILSRVLKLPATRIDLATSFDKYGVDSIVQSTLIQEMEKTLGELSATLLFEHTTAQELIDYLTANHIDKIPGAASQPTVEVKTERFLQQTPESALPLTTQDGPLLGVQRVEASIRKTTRSGGTTNGDIAIIGVSGRYPKSNSMRQLWNNLERGENCVTAVPPNRWASSLRAHAESGVEKEKASTTNEFGGFLENINGFDQRLFGFDSNDVASMTPELRMLLEVVWETFEDAGYSRLRLNATQEENGDGVGLYVGTMYNQFGWSLPSLDAAAMQSNETEWQLANRVSHFFDLRGPSIAVNTACSSSMTAIHLACESLRQSGCAMAIAGGVNLTLNRSKYDRLREVEILGEGEQSKSFGMGTGYVPGEGIGAVLLKPLAMAIRDNDRIDAVIKGSAISHSGGRQKYTVPDPKRQTELIRQSLRKANVDPKTISYVESAANGSPLGDPIEVLALKTAFGDTTNCAPYCALGSVKSNLGHLEAASGISQLSKVLLQLKHKVLAPSIHAKPLNPAIKLEGSSFYLQQEATHWKAHLDPVSGQEMPRRSMINSFGAGGSYGNLIVEEYITQPVAESARELTPRGDEVFVFSAVTDTSLQRYLAAILEYVQESADLPVHGLASSLRKINNNLASRVAIVASTRNSLLAKLAQFLSNSGSVNDGVICSRTLEAADSDRQEEDGLRRSLERWVNGDAAALNDLRYSEDFPCLSLPKYSFDHGVVKSQRVHHGDIDKNGSDIKEDLYRSVFEKVSHGVMSEETAWELLQTAQA